MLLNRHLSFWDLVSWSVHRGELLDDPCHRGQPCLVPITVLAPFSLGESVMQVTLMWLEGQ